jgi:predicted dinucleotide-binding enzyme
MDDDRFGATAPGRIVMSHRHVAPREPSVKIGVIGAGNIGTALAKRLGVAGHQVMLSFNKDQRALEAAARAFGARAGTPREAAAFGEVVVLAAPWGAVKIALQQAGPINSKVLWDCTNPLTPDYTGLEVGTTTSGGEIVASLVPGARVVKAIPPGAQLLMSDDPTIAGKPAVSFLCSDHAAAKALVAPLVAALPAQVVDFGPLANARFAEPAGMIIVRLAFGLNRGYRIGLALLEETGTGDINPTSTPA